MAYSQQSNRLPQQLQPSREVIISSPASCFSDEAINKVFHDVQNSFHQCSEYISLPSEKTLSNMVIFAQMLLLFTLRVLCLVEKQQDTAFEHDETYLECFRNMFSRRLADAQKKGLRKKIFYKKNKEKGTTVSAAVIESVNNILEAHKRSYKKYWDLEHHVIKRLFDQIDRDQKEYQKAWRSARSQKGRAGLLSQNTHLLIAETMYIFTADAVLVLLDHLLLNDMQVTLGNPHRLVNKLAVFTRPLAHLEHTKEYFESRPLPFENEIEKTTFASIDACMERLRTYTSVPDIPPFQEEDENCIIGSSVDHGTDATYVEQPHIGDDFPAGHHKTCSPRTRRQISVFDGNGNHYDHNNNVPLSTTAPPEQRRRGFSITSESSSSMVGHQRTTDPVHAENSHEGALHALQQERDYYKRESRERRIEMEAYKRGADDQTRRIIPALVDYFRDGHRGLQYRIPTGSGNTSFVEYDTAREVETTRLVPSRANGRKLSQWSSPTYNDVQQGSSRSFYETSVPNSSITRKPRRKRARTSGSRY